MTCCAAIMLRMIGHIICRNSYLILMFSSFKETATTVISSLSLHDALPIFDRPGRTELSPLHLILYRLDSLGRYQDRKSTRLNSSHLGISYGVGCLKKKSNRKYVTKENLKVLTLGVSMNIRNNVYTSKVLMY